MAVCLDGQLSSTSLAIGPLPLGHAERGQHQHDQQRAAGDQADHPVAAPRLHGDEPVLRREHHAEDQQHQRAADVDQQLHRADEIGPGQEEQAGRRGQREHQIKRHPHDVAG